MIHTTTHLGVDFFSDNVDQSDLHAWYDRLPKNEVKAAITKIKCREYRPHDQASFRLIVLCRHSFSTKHQEEISSAASDAGGSIDPVLDVLIASFTDWIGRHNMPEEVLLGNHYAFVDWWPIEMLPHFLNDLSPQEQAQLEMDNHILDCLELIRLATISDQAFSQLWVGSNEPFFAAGRLIYGNFEWLREVPSDSFRNGAETQALYERIGECSREYIGLIRLVLLTDAESPLLDQVQIILQRFKVQYATEIPSWQELAHDLIDKTEEIPPWTAIAHPKAYGEIDSACERLRGDLARATEDSGNEVLTLINAILPTLQVPASSLLFVGKANG